MSAAVRNDTDATSSEVERLMADALVRIGQRLNPVIPPAHLAQGRGAGCRA